MFQPLLFDQASGCRVGMLAAFVRAIDRIHGIGRLWRNWWAFRRTSNHLACASLIGSLCLVALHVIHYSGYVLFVLSYEFFD